MSVPMGFEAEALEASKLADMEDGLQYYAELKQHMLARTRRFGSLLAGYLLLQVSGPVSHLEDLLHPANGFCDARALQSFSSDFPGHAAARAVYGLAYKWVMLPCLYCMASACEDCAAQADHGLMDLRLCCQGNSEIGRLMFTGTQP